MAPPLHCHGCLEKYQRSHGADLHCTDECREAYELVREQTQAALRSEGFAQDAAAPNVFVKDGAAVSIEQVVNEGLEVVLAKHARAVAAGA